MGTNPEMAQIGTKNPWAERFLVGAMTKLYALILGSHVTVYFWITRAMSDAPVFCDGQRHVVSSQIYTKFILHVVTTVS
jgi:hypothetical protein